LFNLEELNEIEIELTTRCQAACPMCSRNFHGLLPNKNVKNISWTVSDFKNIINLEILNHVKIISFCGAYGDPLICKDILEICKYIKENSNAEIRINTNGSFYNNSWWQKLADVLPKNHMVIFGIDGFKKNHEKYRIGTDFNKIIENAKSFIANGGNAIAQFISFDYNKNDYEDLKKYLLEIGFTFVFKIYSDRFRNKNFAVLDKNYNKIFELTPDKNSSSVSFDDSDIDHIFNFFDNIKIKCRSIYEKKLYIDARKHLYPCCDTAAVRYEIERLNEPNFNSILPVLKKQIADIHNEYNNLPYIDLTTVSIKQVLCDEKYIEVWKKYWNLKQSFVCNVVCGAMANKKFIDRDSQFIF
jgi:MoaA/NifB/PqqE/SkfB family radical SAM enzyme